MSVVAAIEDGDDDRDLVESARGMGLTERQVLGRVEIPIAMPVVVPNFRRSSADRPRS